MTSKKDITKRGRMYSLIKKSILTFLLLNGFIAQSAMAVDMVPIISYLLSDSGVNSTSNQNRTLTGSFTSSDVSDSYTFTAQSSGEILFAWNEDVNIELYQGTTYLDYGYSGFAGFIVTKDVTYTIKVVNNAALNTDYTVNMVTTGVGAGAEIVPNTSYTDTANESNDMLRSYSFVAISTGRATVKANWYGDTAYAYTYVYENGVYQNYTFGSDHTTLSFDTVAGRTYSIVQRFTDTDYLDLDYNIEVITPNDTRGDAVSVIPNKPYVKTVNQNTNSMDVYNFTAATNGTGYARAAWQGSTNYAYIYVYENGVYLGDYSFGSSSVAVTFDMIAGRNYTVRVNFTDTDNLDVTYGFEVATTNDPRGDAVTVSPNSHYSDTMHEDTNFFGVYNFTATSNGAARAMTSWWGTTNYGYLYYYENGVYKNYTFGSDYNELGFNTVAGRTYTVIFVPTDTDGLTDNYSFNFATTDKTNATPVTLGQTYSTTLNENTNTYATYTFTPATDMSASASASWYSSDYGYMYYYENGVYQNYTFGSSSFGLNVNFRAGRTYTFIIKATDTDNLDETINFSIN